MTTGKLEASPVFNDGRMEQGKSDDTGNRGEGRSLRVRGYVYRETSNFGEVVSDPHKVVYSQEPLWVLDLRLVEPDEYFPEEFRVVLRPQRDEDWWYGHLRYWRGRKPLNG